MPQFSDTQLTTWAQNYERELCAKEDLIVDRISLDITSMVNEYEIPNYVTNIRSVLWQGKVVYAKGFRASVFTGDTPFQTSGSTPFEYVFSGKGLRVLKFLPSPNADIPYYSGDLWTADADQNAVIIEFYRTPDYNSTPQLKLPDWLRKYVLKDHVCWKAFAVEGPTQDLKAARYYQSRLANGIDYVQTIKTNMHASVINILYKDPWNSRRKPGRPVLPPNFGFPVNW
jgi:hypothetical protein